MLTEDIKKEVIEKVFDDLGLQITISPIREIILLPHKISEQEWRDYDSPESVRARKENRIKVNALLDEMGVDHGMYDQQDNGAIDERPTNESTDSE